MRRSRVRLLVAAPLLFGKAIKRLLQGKKRKGLVLLYGKDWAYSVLNRENTGGIPERSKGSDCKSDGYAFEGSNPSPTTMICATASVAHCAARAVCGYGSMVEPQPSKLKMRVRFPLPAPVSRHCFGNMGFGIWSHCSHSSVGRALPW